MGRGRPARRLSGSAPGGPGDGAVSEDEGHAGAVAALARALDQAGDALAAAPPSMVANLECRLAGLQDRFLAARAGGLGDLEARLGQIRAIVAGLGEGGYLLHLVDAAIADVRALQALPAPPASCPPAS